MLHLSASPPQKARFHIAFLLVFIPCCLLAETEEFFWINWCDSSSHCSQRATDPLQQSLNKHWTNTEKYSSFLVYSTGCRSTEIWCMTEMFETPTEVAKKQWDYHESMKYCANLSLIFTEVSAVLRSLLSHFIDRTIGCTGFLWTSENVFVVRTTKHWLRLPREVVEFLEMGKSHLERILAALGVLSSLWIHREELYSDYIIKAPFPLALLSCPGVTSCQSNEQGLQCDEDGEYRPSQQDPGTKKSLCVNSSGAALDWTETEDLLTDDQCLGKWQKDIFDMLWPHFLTKRIILPQLMRIHCPIVIHFPILVASALSHVAP